MEFTNTHVRRQDRLLDEETAKALLAQGEYGVLSLQAEEGGGYGVPVNYVWDGKHFMYLHCAPQGRKLRCIELCNKVSFCVAGKTNIVSHKFTTGYESILLHCTAHIHLPDGERMHALKLLLDKYSFQDKENGMKYAEKSFNRTGIIRLDIDHWSGKCKIV